LTPALILLTIEYMSAPTVPGIATLQGDAASKVERESLKLAAPGSGKSLVVAVSVRDAVEAALITDVLSVLKSRLGDDRDSRERVLRALLPAERLTMSPAVLEQVNRNAAAHAELAEEFGLLSSTQVAELAKSKSVASNPAALANRWRKERKVFTVEVEGGAQRFPGFQFGTNGKPRPVIAQVLAAVDDRLTGWELALWFTGSNGWLGGERPADVLDSDPELVVEAAGHLAAEIRV
jgi:hypothetical protein